MNNALIQLEDGSWIDQKTVAALWEDPYDDRKVVIERYPPFLRATIGHRTKEAAQACRNNIAAARNLAEEPAHPTPPVDVYDGDRP